MDWLYVLMPISGVTIFWPGLIILGLGVGIIVDMPIGYVEKINF